MLFTVKREIPWDKFAKYICTVRRKKFGSKRGDHRISKYDLKIVLGDTMAKIGRVFGENDLKMA